MDTVEKQRETIRQCVRAVQQAKSHNNEFILVGGAGGILAGSKRTTSDMDFLLATWIDLHKLRDELLDMEGFKAPGAVLTFHGPTSMTIDFLSNTVLDKTFDDLKEHTFTSEGVRLLMPEIALAIKLHCIYQRAEDANGARKRNTDLEDIIWISATMASRTPPMVISDQVAAAFKLGHYSLLLTRFALEESGSEVANLVAVGVEKMLHLWEEDTPEQREYFEMFAAPGGFPLTCPLLEEKEEEDDEV